MDRHWSYVVPLDTSTGKLWLKANGSGYSHEGALTAFLSTVAPESVLAPLAVSEQDGYLLLPDGGSTLGSRTDAAVWVPIVRRYAAVQRQLESEVDHLRAMGVPDISPDKIAVALAEVLDNKVAISGLTVEELRQLRTAVGTVAGLASELDRSSVRPTWNHDDLKGEHVFVRGLRQFDLGDSVISHPYCSLNQLGRFLQFDGIAPGEWEEIQSAYLDERNDGLTPTQLARTQSLCEVIESIIRARNWLRAGEVAMAAYPRAVGDHLRRLLVGLERIERPGLSPSLD